MSTLKVNEVRHLSNSGTANMVLESNANTNLQTTSTLGLTVNGTLTVSGVATFNGNAVVGNASTDTLSLTSTVSGSSNFSGFTGEIRMYAGNADGNSPPAGWLYCNGDTLSQTSGNGGDHHNSDGTGNDYQPLFNLLKASNDWANSSSSVWGTNTVKVPDFRSRSPVGIHTGASNAIASGLTARTLGDTAGTETHSLTIAELATHTHSTTAAASATGQSISTITAEQSSHTHTIDPPSTTTNTTGSHNHSNGSYNRLLRVTGGATIQYTDSSGGEPDLISTGTIVAAGDHSHTLDISSFTSGATDPAITISGGALGGETHTHSLTTANTGSGTAHTILSPIIAVNYIIKV